MKISARNFIKGKVASVKKGAVNGIVAIECGDKTIKADITNEAIDSLGLEEGKDAYAVIKASNVMVATGDEAIANISARNQLQGTIAAITEGAVNGHVTIDLGCAEASIKASITNEAISDLGLKVGDTATAIIKSTDVMVAID